MKRVLIVCAHRPNRSPSQRYRFEQYLPALKEKGYEFDWSFLIEESEDQEFYSAGNFLLKAHIITRAHYRRFLLLMSLRKYSLVFIQRESLFTGSTFFERHLSKKKLPFIYDFDDSVWLADTSPGNQKFEWLKKPEKVFESMRLANCVLAGNAYLAEKAKLHAKDVRLVPTTIDTSVHIPMPNMRTAERVVIGWSGSISTIKHFQILKPVLKRLIEKYDQAIEIMVMANQVYQDPELPITSLIWTSNYEVQNLNRFHIGIMPLPDDEWSRGKCGLKGLSYMACEVATVMSPVGVNTEIITSGENGFLASTENEWFNTLCQLIEQKDLREKIAKAGRKTVEIKYSVSANFTKYFQAFEDVSAIR